MVKAAFEGKELAAEGQDEIQDKIYSYADYPKYDLNNYVKNSHIS
jgi:hypothetical protein